MDKLLLTPHEAAQMLGIGRSKLYQLMRAGTVASVRIGSCRRIPAASLPDLIAQLTADLRRRLSVSPRVCPQGPRSSTVLAAAAHRQLGPATPSS